MSHGDKVSTWYMSEVNSRTSHALGRRYVLYMSQQLSKACARVSVVLHLKPFLFQLNWLHQLILCQHTSQKKERKHWHWDGGTEKN